MSDIKDIKKEEMSEIEDFCEHIREHGHVFHFDTKRLDAPFKQILGAIEEIKQMMEDSFDM